MYWHWVTVSSEICSAPAKSCLRGEKSRGHDGVFWAAVSSR